MKKILTIALVALLAAGSVFAGLSGYSNLGFGYNSKSGKFGFNPESALTVDLDVATAEGSNIGEGDIYAGIDGSIALRLVDSADASYAANTYIYSDADDNGSYGLGVFAFINSAYIAGQDWKVSFGTASSNPVDFAKSAIDTYKTVSRDEWYTGTWTKDANVSYKAGYTGANGLAATYKDYTVGVGFDGLKSKFDDKVYMEYTGYFMTPEIALGDASVKFGAVVSQGYKKNTTEITKYKYETTYDDTTGEQKVKRVEDGTKEITVEDKNGNVQYLKTSPNAGASIQLAYAADKFSAKASADFGLENIGAEENANEFHFDAAANIKYDFISVDGYYANNVTVQTWALKDWAPYKSDKKTYKNLASAKVVVDLKSFDVPVALTLQGKDLINKQDLSAEVKVSVSEAFSFKVKGGYVIKDEKITAGGSVEYKAEKFTASAEASFTLKKDGSKQLYPTVVVSSDALVNGATLELAWKSLTDDTNKTTTNLLDKEADFGKIYATAKLAF